MVHTVSEGLVAYVRQAEGGVVQLNAGDAVPAEADEKHVAELVKSGVLSEAKTPATPAKPKD